MVGMVTYLLLSAILLKFQAILALLFLIAASKLVLPVSVRWRL